MPIEIKEHGDAVSFKVRVQPRASRGAIAGDWGGTLKVRLTAPPVDDRANDALCRLLAERLNVSRAAVRITGGAHGRTKQVEICGVTAAHIQALAATAA